MESREWTTIDKASWGPGTWQEEPDKKQWGDPATGMPCLAVRHRTSGHWCGYVGVTGGHPFYEKGYDDVEMPGGEEYKYIQCHGGLTFSAFCDESADEGKGICHLPGPGEPEKVWWLGFDCAHIDDLSPGIVARIGRCDQGEHYRDLAYVQNECATLAEQFDRARGERP